MIIHKGQYTAVFECDNCGITESIPVEEGIPPNWIMIISSERTHCSHACWIQYNKENDIQAEE